MIIPINIYSQDLQSQFSLTQRDIDNLIEGVIGYLSRRLYLEWQQEAKLVLKKTRNEYIRSLKFFSEGPLKGGVMLVGALPNMLESGAPPFDMKTGFLNSSKAKTTKKGGVYLTIPFRMATSGSLGESSVFSGVLPAPVEKAIKEAKKGKAVIPSPYDTPKTRMRIETPSGQVFEEYKHKFSIYQGGVKESKTYEHATSSQYIFFRRVSNNSSSESWIHPGFVSLGLAEKALSRMNLPEEVGAAIDDALINMGFE